MMKRSGSATIDAAPPPPAVEADDADDGEFERGDADWLALLDSDGAARSVVGLLAVAAAGDARLSFFAVDVGDAAADDGRDFDADAADFDDATGVDGGVLLALGALFAAPLAVAVATPAGVVVVVDADAEAAPFSRCCALGDRTTVSMAAAAVKSTR